MRLKLPPHTKVFSLRQNLFMKHALKECLYDVDYLILGVDDKQ
jgi:hypothetical protein